MSCSMVWLYAAMQVAHSAICGAIWYIVYSAMRSSGIHLYYCYSRAGVLNPGGVKCKSGVTGVSWGFWTALRVHLIVTESH